MNPNTEPDKNPLFLRPIQPEVKPTVADLVFDELRQRILALDLPPLTKISEAEVATAMGVSRQPVREAFKRLAKLGLLAIRPQSGTYVTLISEDAILKARFIRKALELQTSREACHSINEAGIDELRAIIDEQRLAIEQDDAQLFHSLDDKFHREICVQAGVEYVWSLIQESKAHMDRIRRLSLNSESQQQALEDHIIIIEAIEQREPDQAASAIDTHLDRILGHIEAIKAQNHSWFEDLTP